MSKKAVPQPQPAPLPPDPPKPPPEGPPQAEAARLWIFAVLLLVTIPVGIFLPRFWGLLPAWLIILVCLLGMFGVIGLSRGMGFLGILVDAGRNMMSLSRLQIVLWTCVILSAFLAVALGRIGDYAYNQAGYECTAPPPAKEGEAPAEPECAEPLGIQLPAVLWGLMGISMTSAVASPLLKANKTQRTAEQDRIQKEKEKQSAQAIRNAQARGLDPVPEPTTVTYGAVLAQRKAANEPSVENAQDSVGVMVRKTSWREASFADVFTGEEVSTFGYVDMAKVQNFFFTVIAVIAYAVMLGGFMAAAGKQVAGFFVFPDLTESLLAILGISHAGYLVDKPFTHSVPDEDSRTV
jgi:hypothetical protein